MANNCTVCAHPERTAIERALVDGLSLRRIGTRHGVAPTSIRRHRDRHLRRALAHALEKSENFEGVDADKLVEWAYSLQAKTLVLIERAEKGDDLANAARLIAEARRNLELMGRITGVLEAPKINIDARKQLNVIAKLDENALRALASGDVIEGEAVEVDAVEVPRHELVEAVA